MKKFTLVLSALVVFLMGSSFDIKPITLKVDVNKSSAKWLAKKVTGQHTGTVNIKSGSLVFNENRPVSGEFVIDMNTIAVTDLQGEWAGKLENHLKSDDFFNVANHQTAKFVMKNAAATIDPKKFVITGDLTIKGITKPLTFDAIVDMSSASAKIIIDRTKYDIKYRSSSFFESLGDKAIDNDFALNVQLALIK
ncbi:MAG: YceI family protein [Saprospiraceae bacterium]|nr:YceI family protein [Saprospiraceae bacterium]